MYPITIFKNYQPNIVNDRIQCIWSDNIRNLSDVLPVSYVNDGIVISLKRLKAQYGIASLPLTPSWSFSLVDEQFAIRCKIRMFDEGGDQTPSFCIKTVFGSERNIRYTANVHDFFLLTEQWQQIEIPFGNFVSNDRKCELQLALIEFVLYNDNRYEVADLQVVKPTTYKLLVPKYPWIYQDVFPMRVFYRDNQNRIIFTAGICHNYKWISLLRPTDHLVISLPCDYTLEDFEREKRFIATTEVPLDQWYILCNTTAQTTICNTIGLQGYYVNQNCFIDESLVLLKRSKHVYNAIYNARPIAFKRHELATHVRNLALIIGYDHFGPKTDLSYLDVGYSNTKRLTTREVCAKIQQSKVALILSASEGACYSSSEYLLCGTPVVSTVSEGGRDIWYNDYNSIVCDSTPEAVADAVIRLGIKVDTKQIDPNKIRNDHIALMVVHRQAFIHFIAGLFHKIDVNIDARSYVIDNFTHKMIEGERYLPYHDVQIELDT